VFCGTISDFSIYNRPRTSKNLDIKRIHQSWDNPSRLYCYGDSIDTFISILPHIKNNFVLVTHNSDINITAKYTEFLNSPKLLFWHAQNVMFNHPKLGGLPIGIANSTWAHGNLNSITNIMMTTSAKTSDFYFHFSIGTNRTERQPCHDQLVKKGLVFGASMRFDRYLTHLASHKYAICPAGNGIDCHRIWECYYLNVIPIVKRSIFTEKLVAILPCVLLDDWDDFNAETLLASYKMPTQSDKLRLSVVLDCLNTHRDYFIGTDNNGFNNLE